jgi:DNA-binding transcriptional LysR family regulator
VDRDLLAFIAIAEAGNITAAAEKVGLAQPSLTKKLQLIELAYGGKLFERLPRGMKLTRLGKCLYEYAKRMEALHFQTKEAIALQRKGHLDVLRIAAGPVFHMLYLSKIIHALHQGFPSTTIDLFTGSHDLSIRGLLNGELDIVLGQLRGVRDTDLIVLRSFLSFERGVVLNPAFAATLNGEPTAKDLQSCYWLTFGSHDSPDHAMIEFFADSHLLPPKLVLSSTSLTALVQLVKLGNYAVIIPERLRFLAENAGVSWIRISLKSVEGGAYFRRSTANYPIVKRFMSLMSDIDQGQ